MKFLSIDFSQSWTQLIKKQQHLFMLITLLVVIAQGFMAITPFLLAKAFEWGVSMLVMVLVGWIIAYTAMAYAMRLNANFQLQCIHSIFHNAHQALLTVDPYYHAHRSSGALLGKIDRGARGCEELLDQITLEFTPLAISLITMVVVLMQYSGLLTLLVVCAFCAMIALGYFFARDFCNVWERKFIATDDAFRNTAVENLAQVQLVRATYASDFMSEKLDSAIRTNMFSERTLWLTYMNATYVLNLLYSGSVAVLLFVLYWYITQGSMTIVSAVGLALAYISSTRELVKIIKPLRRYMRSWTAVSDLFSAISHFGKQQYPVLGPVMLDKPVDDRISLQAVSISFDYKLAQLFEGHTLDIVALNSQQNKLYGIIGPSGSGKTTLLSILGGQLKPSSGTVMLNGVDIYTLNDATRRTMIALQGQTATNLKGSVKYNLLFGLPALHGYDDAYLVDILARVGLYGVLSNGLETMLGEGGLNLSGGQRQRLNFAGLYLRARYYKPLLILIDEPTSSLDEISEAAITGMIHELAASAITLVIAHRLKTLDNAVGLIDVSLLQQEKLITVHSSDELEKRSPYYRELLQRKINLDS